MTERSPDVETTTAPSVGSETRPITSTPRTTALPPLPGTIGERAPPVAPRPILVDAVIGDEPDDEPASTQEVLMQLPSWLASMVVHLALVLVLALLTFTGEGSGRLQDLLISVSGDNRENRIEELENELMQSAAELEQTLEVTPAEFAVAPQPDTLAGPIGLIQPENPQGATEVGTPGGADGGDPSGSPLALRLNGAVRAQMLRDGGGTPDSEEAVQRALHWLAEHQNYDGSWTFQHQKSPKCQGACDHPGFVPGKIAATAMALLPFLGSGETHREGVYRRQIDKGLKFLISSMEMRGELGSLYDQGGQMYGHGLASIALCEAYGMTHDPHLRDAAQASINFIAEAQDPVGGGWRYQPQQPGDTSVVGWQLMALKSAQMAYLDVPPSTMRKAGYFLDQVQSDRGAVYGYQRPERGRPATTAIGLLSRMYLGWTRDHAPLKQGVNILGTMGPSIDASRFQNNMYYNYYATQVMHHYGGPEWKRWNKVMRDYLVETQAVKGHETGSWYFPGSDHGAGAGGRLYFTAMAAMTLEVYYRHMPLYRPQSTQVLPGQ